MSGLLQLLRRAHGTKVKFAILVFLEGRILVNIIQRKCKRSCSQTVGT